MHIKLLIGGVIVRVLDTGSSAVDREFEPRSVQTKDYKVGVCVLLLHLARSTKERERATTGWLGIRIKCSSGATCLPENCCYSELAL